MSRGKVKVAFIVGGDGHDGAAAIVHQDIVGHVDRHAGAVHWVGRVSSGKDAVSACLDALVARGASTADAFAEGKAMLVRIYQMLTKLVQRYESSDVVREEEVEYGVGAGDEHECLASDEEKIEHEDEDDDEDD